MKKTICLAVFCAIVGISGCGVEKNVAEPPPKVADTITNSKGQKFEILDTIAGRPILAKLKETATEPTKRNLLTKEISTGDDFQNGTFGKPTDDLAEELAIQSIEGRVAIEAFEQVYGGYEGTENTGVVFFEWKSSGAKQSGFWIGIKDPDERLHEFVTILQGKVDAGEILASYIHIFQSPRTQKEQNQLAANVSSSLQRIARSYKNPESVSGSVSVNTITNVIEISHDFLTEKHKEILESEYPDDEIKFEQDGRMVPIGDEPDITYPTVKTTTTQSEEGYYVLEVTQTGMHITSATSKDYSATGGVKEFIDALDVIYPDAHTKLQVGQRISVEYSGSIQTSYPGKGRAKFVEVLPDYKPAQAILSESQVIRKAIALADKENGRVPLIRGISFDEKLKVWILSMKKNEEDYEIKIEDK